MTTINPPTNQIKILSNITEFDKWGKWIVVLKLLNYIQVYLSIVKIILRKILIN